MTAPARPAVVPGRRFVAPDRGDWQANAACRGIGDSAFFATDELGPGASRQYRRTAYTYCRICTTRPNCLGIPLAAESPGTSRHGRYGLYGGLTPQQRAEDPDLVAAILAGGPLVVEPPGAAPGERPVETRPCVGCETPVEGGPGRRNDLEWWCKAPDCRRTQIRLQRRRTRARQREEAMADA